MPATDKHIEFWLVDGRRAKRDIDEWTSHDGTIRMFRGDLRKRLRPWVFEVRERSGGQTADGVERLRYIGRRPANCGDLREVWREVREPRVARCDGSGRRDSRGDRGARPGGRADGFDRRAGLKLRKDDLTDHAEQRVTCSIWRAAGSGDYKLTI